MIHFQSFPLVELGLYTAWQLITGKVRPYEFLNIFKLKDETKPLIWWCKTWFLLRKYFTEFVTPFISLLGYAFVSVNSPKNLASFGEKGTYGKLGLCLVRTLSALWPEIGAFGVYTMEANLVWDRKSENTVFWGKTAFFSGVWPDGFRQRKIIIHWSLLKYCRFLDGN